MSDDPQRPDDVSETERELRDHEREAREREAHERDSQGDAPGDRPAPPGPESQQPRG